MAFTDRKIATYSGINDAPVAPTSTKGGNGAHMVAQHNGLCDDSQAANTALTAKDADLQAQITTEKAKVTALQTSVSALQTQMAAIATTYAAIGHVHANYLTKAQADSLYSAIGGSGGGTGELFLPDSMIAANETEIVGKRPNINTDKWVKLSAGSDNGRIYQNGAQAATSRVSVIRDSVINDYTITAQVFGETISSGKGVDFYVRAGGPSKPEAIIVQFIESRLHVFRTSDLINFPAIGSSIPINFTINNWLTVDVKVTPTKIEIYLESDLLRVLNNAEFASNTYAGFGVYSQEYFLRNWSLTAN